MMFNSPLEFCTVCKEYVAVDQTQRECALEHRCAADSKCPLRALFARSESAMQTRNAPEAVSARADA